MNKKRSLCVGIIGFGIVIGGVLFFAKDHDKKDLIISSQETEQELQVEESFEVETEEILQVIEDSGSISEAQSLPEETIPVYQYYKNLDELKPGTVLDVNLVDFENLDQYFTAQKIEIGDSIYERINGKSYHDNEYVPLESLSYLKMLHYNFSGDIQVGEMIVSKEIESDVKEIFKELFEQKYQIQSMYLVDNYWTGDPGSTDSASIDVNNTSAFCYRVVTGGKKLSNHAYGKAIDLNPQQNPYVSYSTGEPRWSHQNANDYIKRDTDLPHVITHNDLAYKVFTNHGFRWGGDWNNPKDYQHFDKNDK